MHSCTITCAFLSNYMYIFVQLHVHFCPITPITCTLLSNYMYVFFQLHVHFCPLTCTFFPNYMYIFQWIIWINKCFFVNFFFWKWLSKTFSVKCKQSKHCTCLLVIFGKSCDLLNEIIGEARWPTKKAGFVTIRNNCYDNEYL